MKYFSVLFCLVLLAAACLPGQCTIPSFRGYTGLMVVPSADALGKGEWNAGFFFEDVASGTVNDIVANYGFAQGLEFGINRFRRDEESDHRTFLNAKYRFMPETANRPAVALGLADITDEIETTVYAVASKSLGCGVRSWEGEVLSPRLHVGFGGGRLSGLFAGATAFVGNRVELMAEWDSNNVNAGARFRITRGFTVHVGGFNLTDQEDDEFSTGASFGVGASYNVTY
ncbi:MAG: YjbH domain-containing protein [Armatimonadetes bacterium]|nr:YjbH domain-containing protein [Armatimonadota bacterium]